MPGLNQLKKFANDMLTIGDEVKIRAQRGEKPAVVPLPEGISEEDDSEDFVLGLPDSQNNTQNDSKDDIPADLDSLSTDEEPETADSFDLDSLLNNQNTADSSMPDLSEFLDEEETKTPQQEAPEETPLEDLDLEALLKASENSKDKIQEEEPLDTEQELTQEESTAPDLEEFSDLASIEKNETDSTGDENKPSEQPKPKIDQSESELSENSSLDDEFSFDGQEIDLNADIPDEIADLDGSAPEDDFEMDSSLKEQMSEDSPEQKSGSETNEFDLPDFDSDFGTSFDSTNDTAAVDTALNENLADNRANDSLADEILANVVPQENSPEETLDTQPKNESEENLSFDSFEQPETEKSTGENSDLGLSDFDIPDIGDFGSAEDAGSQETADGLDSSGQLNSVEAENDSAAQEILNGLNLPVDASDDVPAEDFSNALEGLESADNIDFGTPVVNIEDEFKPTEAKINNSDDDFALDTEDFNIPGFSDTQTAAFDKKGRPKVDVVDFSKAGAKPKNTLTEEEYETFRKNLAVYPLNLRLAVEDLIVKNEFTDDAVFEIIEKILKKTPARQLASQLEKMLDIAIDVPRDYERRSVAQYEAYKQSFQYQLKNRIIPGAILTVVIATICALLFQAGVLFIYKPAMASMLYKQGYTLLENNEYPQSEAKFNQAVQYRSVKKWFYKYAQGYRAHKQFDRAENMYKNTLKVFKNDKPAGLEWAEMELYDRANYEKAENTVRREVLDYHINDPDARLLLGDIFLEWAETDNSKYDKARDTYFELVKTSKSAKDTDLYMSRLLRYYIRTDKLQIVLELKKRFFPREKSLVAKDWTELSGYLLDKLYGPLIRGDEEWRAKIEDVKAMLDIAKKLEPQNPTVHYNMARYYEHNSNFELARRELQTALDCFDKLEFRTKKTVYQEIDSCRILGELFADVRQYIKAQEVYTRGITLFQNEHERSGFEGDLNTGKLYADMGDIEYFISGDMDAALKNYEQAVANKNATPGINFRIGAINYNKQNYLPALEFFNKSYEKVKNDPNLLLSLANALVLRGNNNAAQGIYSQLLSILDSERVHHDMLFPHQKEEDNALLEMYLKVNNNLGVVLYKISRRTGKSQKNGNSFACFAESIRAWDALTRNPETMVRLGGSNLALQNSKYITASMAEFEPAIYTAIPKTLTGEKVLE